MVTPFNHFLTSCVLLVFAAIAVSKDHKPDQTEERQRIEDAGGFVMWAGKVDTAFSSLFLDEICLPIMTMLCFIGTWRVGGVLAVSRAFGDKLLKQYVVVDPEIRVRNLPLPLQNAYCSVQVFLVLGANSSNNDLTGMVAIGGVPSWCLVINVSSMNALLQF